MGGEYKIASFEYTNNCEIPKKVFAGATFTFEDDRFTYEEQRFITLGMLKGTVVVIVHTERNKVIRIISMRKATRNEQKIYFQRFTN